MKDLNIQIQGKTVEDLELALQEVSRLVSEGFIEGQDRNEDGRFSFSIVNKQKKPCECHLCIKENDSLPLNTSKMILCPKCGNKRCPHASDHRLSCTGSNEPGQPGSIFT